MSSVDEARAGVLCAGSVIVDIGKVVDRYPERDHLATIESISLSSGGPGLNMAIDLRMLGAAWPVGVAGAVGDDDNGAFVLAECARRRVDTAAVRVVPGALTSFTDAMVEAEGGRRTFFHHAGANGVFDGSWLDVESSAARLLHVGAPGIHAVMDTVDADGGNGWSALLARGRAAGMRTNLELVSIATARIATLAGPCLPLLDTIVINEFEACALTGIEATAPSVDPASVQWTKLEQAALGLVSLGVSTLAVVHFPAGCVAAAPDGRTWRQGSVCVPAADVRSTTGAGDAFAAGVLFGLHEGWPVPRCLQLGVASAATSIRDPHTSDGIRPAADCLARASRDGYRPT